jgi:hypothetical protein
MMGADRPAPKLGRSSREEATVSQFILAQGPPPLTEAAADAALDAIDFIAAAVRGYDAMDVTNVVRPIWRAHLAFWYPQLPPETRVWYANAPQMLASMLATWPLLDWSQRQPFVRRWTVELPYMLWMVDPVLAEAQAVEMQIEQRHQLESMRQEALLGQPNEAVAEQKANDAFARQSQMTTAFQNYSKAMASTTLDLMRGFNRS